MTAHMQRTACSTQSEGVECDGAKKKNATFMWRKGTEPASGQGKAAEKLSDNNGCERLTNRV